MEVETAKPCREQEGLKGRCFGVFYRSPAGPAAVEWLCSSLCGLCEQVGDIPSEDTELARRLLSGKELGWGQGRTSEEQQHKSLALCLLTSFLWGICFLYVWQF